MVTEAVASGTPFARSAYEGLPTSFLDHG